MCGIFPRDIFIPLYDEGVERGGGGNLHVFIFAENGIREQQPSFSTATKEGLQRVSTSTTHSINPLIGKNGYSAPPSPLLRAPTIKGPFSACFHSEQFLISTPAPTTDKTT